MDSKGPIELLQNEDITHGVGLIEGGHKIYEDLQIKTDP